MISPKTEERRRKRLEFFIKLLRSNGLDGVADALQTVTEDDGDIDMFFKSLKNWLL